MKSESSFVCSSSQNWLLFSSCLAISNVSNGWILLYKAFSWFPAFQGFRFFAIYLIRKPKNHGMFSLLFFKEVNTCYLQNFVNQSVWLGKRWQIAAKSYWFKESLESRDSFPHLPSQNSIYIPSLFVLSWFPLSSFLLTTSVSKVCFLV